MKTAFTTWVLLVGLLLQSVAWALPGQPSGQAERLTHELAHAIDHGHHVHLDPTDAAGHDIDAALLLDTDRAPDGSPHGSHHVHVSESVQLQGLPVAHALAALALSCGAPCARSLLHPPSADPVQLLRPPRRAA